MCSRSHNRTAVLIIRNADMENDKEQRDIKPVVPANPEPGKGTADQGYKDQFGNTHAYIHVADGYKVAFVREDTSIVEDAKPDAPIFRIENKQPSRRGRKFSKPESFRDEKVEKWLREKDDYEYDLENWICNYVGSKTDKLTRIIKPIPPVSTFHNWKRDFFRRHPEYGQQKAMRRKTEKKVYNPDPEDEEYLKRYKEL